MACLPFLNRDPQLGMNPKQRYFTDLTFGKVVLYGLAVAIVAAVCLSVITEIFIDIPCYIVDEVDIEYKNPSYDPDPCRHVRYPQIFWLTKEECTFGRSQVAAVLLGGVIGWERRQADRPVSCKSFGQFG